MAGAVVNARKFSDEERAEVERRAEAGETAPQIAKALGRTADSVRGHAAGRGISTGLVRRVTMPEVRAVRRMSTCRFPAPMIAGILGAPSSRIENIRRRFDITVPQAEGHNLNVYVSGHALGVLSDAALRWSTTTGRVAVCVLEAATRGSHDLLPHLLPSAPRPPRPAPVATLFSVELRAGM